MRKSKLRKLKNATLALTSTALLQICLTTAAGAAQDHITASQDALLEDIEIAIGQADLTIIDEAQTDRFAMIYAQRNDGSHVTITLHQVPPEDTDITVAVHTDSPRDEDYEQALLTVFLATQAVESQPE